MNARLATLSGIPLVVACGDIDHASCDELDEVLNDAILQGSPILLLDLSEVSYVDSGGLSVLFSAGRRVRQNGWIGLVAPNPSVRRLLEIVGALADPAFQVFDDLAQAENALSAEGLRL